MLIPPKKKQVAVTEERQSENLLSSEQHYTGNIPIWVENNLIAEQEKIPNILLLSRSSGMVKSIKNGFVFFQQLN